MDTALKERDKELLEEFVEFLERKFYVRSGEIKDSAIVQFLEDIGYSLLNTE